MDRPTEKRTEIDRLPLSAFKDELGNPTRKITKKKLQELQESLETLGDFGVIVVDEHNNIISGHQRAKALQALYGDEHVVDVKRLIGYTVPELKAINIRANTHAGEWNMDGLAEWTSDLNLKLGLDLPSPDRDEVKDKLMEPMRFEKYDYVLIAFKNEIDYMCFQRILGLDQKKVFIAKKKNGVKTVKARAIWFEDFIEKVPLPKEKM